MIIAYSIVCLVLGINAKALLLVEFTCLIEFNAHTKRSIIALKLSG